MRVIVPAFLEITKARKRQAAKDKKGRHKSHSKSDGVVEGCSGDWRNEQFSS